MFQLLSGDLIAVALALQALLDDLAIPVLLIAVLVMHLLPGELGELREQCVDLREPALREEPAHVANEVVGVDEDVRAIGALGELDLAPAQQVHQHERMVEERQAYYGSRPLAWDNLRVGILVGSIIFIF